TYGILFVYLSIFLIDSGVMVYLFFLPESMAASGELENLRLVTVFQMVATEWKESFQILSTPESGSSLKSLAKRKNLDGMRMTMGSTL
ncbi:hypothetical protein HDU82_003781, partial [Entophlyctis luteolus]